MSKTEVIQWANIAQEYIDSHAPLATFGGTTYRYERCVWQPLTQSQINSVKNDLRNYLTSRHPRYSITNTFVSNVWGHVLSRIDKKLPFPEGTLNGCTTDYIAFANGLYDPADKVLRKPNKAYYTTFGLTFAFEERTKSPIYDKFLEEVLPDPIARDLWHEYAAYALLTTHTHQQKFMVLYGEPRSGKGTLLRVLQGMSENHYASPKLHTLVSNTFAAGNLIGKRLCITPDDTLSFTTSTESALVSFLLAATGEDGIDTEQKFKDPTTQKVGARIFIQSNNPFFVKTNEKSFAARRLLLCFANSFIGCEDTSLGAKLAREYPQIIHHLLDGLERLNRQGFSQPADSIREAERIKNKSNPLFDFANDCLTFEGKTPTADITTAYQEWCAEGGVQPIGNRPFGVAIKNFGVDAETIKGVRYYNNVRLKHAK